MSTPILILDDEQSYAEMIRDLIASHGYDSDVFTNPGEALQELKKHAYRLVVVDFRMPEMDGAEFLLRARKIYPQIPVIMVSGLMNTPDLIRVANLGGTLVLEKPFDTDLFLDYVSRFVHPMASEKIPEEGPQAIELSFVRRKQEQSAYPQPLKYLSTASALSQSYVQKVWAASRDQHVFLALPAGSELGEIVKEVASWMGMGDRKVYRLNAFRLNTPEGLGLLDSFEKEGRNPLILVDDCCDKSNVLNWLLAFARMYNESENRFFTFVYALGDKLGNHHKLDTVSEQGLIRVPALVKRPADIADYAQKILADSRKKLSQQAIHLLLSYSWPYNYEELRACLLYAICRSDSVYISGDVLLEAIHRYHGRVAMGGGFSMEDILMRHQELFLNDNSRGTVDDTLSFCGVDAKHRQEASSFSDLKLLYPELLTRNL